MKKLLILALFSLNLHAAELVYNSEFNTISPTPGYVFPDGFQIKTTGTVNTYDTQYPTYDSNGQYYALKLISQSNYQVWVAQLASKRIAVTAGSTYRFSDRTKCNGVMNVKIEHYNGTTLLKHEILSAPTFSDSVWHTITKDFIVPAGTNKISIGRHAVGAKWCNIGNVSLTKLN